MRALQSTLFALLVAAPVAGCGSAEESLGLEMTADKQDDVGQSAAAILGVCGSPTTLRDLLTCVLDRMPDEGSEGFVAPSAAAMSDMNTVARQMLAGDCKATLPASLSPLRLFPFSDVTTGKTYCVLMEVEDADNDGTVDRGWGTFIVDPTAERALHHQAPHPLHESGTETEALELFQAMSARSFLMCGAHREANAAESACDTSYQAADCAHATDNMFAVASRAIEDFHASRSELGTQIQWHGMALSTCPGVSAYLSQGSASAPAAGSVALTIASRMAQIKPTWNVAVTGTGICSLNATNNVEGRALNGVTPANVCRRSATRVTGEFLHIEQQPQSRKAQDWLPALLNAFPTALTVPPK